MHRIAYRGTAVDAAQIFWVYYIESRGAYSSLQHDLTIQRVSAAYPLEQGKSMAYWTGRLLVLTVSRRNAPTQESNDLGQRLVKVADLSWSRPKNGYCDCCFIMLRGLVSVSALGSALHTPV